MRDIQKVLDRWGAWAAGGGDTVDYAPIAAGFKGLLPATRKSRVSCCDDDGIMISAAMNTLKKKDAYLCALLEMYYIRQIPLRALGDKLGISRNLVAMRLQCAEGFIDGCLAALGAPLEMDRECQKEAL
ncbi:antitermination protein [Citrobacter freundii]|nr:antitermination protein [Citrobacter freundii]